MTPALSFRGGQRPSPESINTTFQDVPNSSALFGIVSGYGFRAPLSGPGMTVRDTHHVMAGLVPAVPIRNSAAPFVLRSPAQGR